MTSKKMLELVGHLSSNLKRESSLDILDFKERGVSSRAASSWQTPGVWRAVAAEPQSGRLPTGVVSPQRRALPSSDSLAEPGRGTRSPSNPPGSTPQTQKRHRQTREAHLEIPHVTSSEPSCPDPAPDSHCPRAMLKSCTPPTPSAVWTPLLLVRRELPREVFPPDTISDRV